MLNYGAAAQVYFAKQEDANIDVTTLDLANKNLSEDEQAIGTFTPCTNKDHNHSREGGETINRFFMATSVRFDDSISLVFKFDLRAYDIKDMKAEFIYTDHNGKEQTLRACGEGAVEVHTKAQTHNCGLEQVFRHLLV